MPWVTITRAVCLGNGDPVYTLDFAGSICELNQEPEDTHQPKFPFTEFAEKSEGNKVEFP